MASLRTDNGWYFLDFRYQRVRCREYLNLQEGSRDATVEAKRIKRDSKLNFALVNSTTHSFSLTARKLNGMGLDRSEVQRSPNSHASGLKSNRI